MAAAAEEADKDEAELRPELLRKTQQVYLLCCCKACESQPLLVREQSVAQCMASGTMAININIIICLLYTSPSPRDS